MRQFRARGLRTGTSKDTSRPQRSLVALTCMLCLWGLLKLADSMCTRHQQCWLTTRVHVGIYKPRRIWIDALHSRTSVITWSCLSHSALEAVTINTLCRDPSAHQYMAAARLIDELKRHQLDDTKGLALQPLSQHRTSQWQEQGRWPPQPMDRTPRGQVPTHQCLSLKAVPASIDAPIPVPAIIMLQHRIPHILIHSSIRLSTPCTTEFEEGLSFADKLQGNKSLELRSGRMLKASGFGQSFPDWWLSELDSTGAGCGGLRSIAAFHGSSARRRKRHKATQYFPDWDGLFLGSDLARGFAASMNH